MARARRPRTSVYAKRARGQRGMLPRAMAMKALPALTTFLETRTMSAIVNLLRPNVAATTLLDSLGMLWLAPVGSSQRRSGPHIAFTFERFR